MPLSVQDPQNGACVMRDSDSFHWRIQSGIIPGIASLIQLSIRPPSVGLRSVLSPENWLKSYKEASCKIVLEFFFISLNLLQWENNVINVVIRLLQLAIPRWCIAVVHFDIYIVLMLTNYCRRAHLRVHWNH